MVTTEQALAALRTGRRIARAAWMALDVYAFLARYAAPDGSYYLETEDYRVGNQPRVEPVLLRNAPYNRVVPYIMDAADLFATDWLILDAHTVPRYPVRVAA